MKRRRFLQALGAGSVGAGAMVGTGGSARITSQRRVKIEVGEPESFDASKITCVTFYARETAPNVTRADAIEFTDDGDPVTVDWRSRQPITRIVVCVKSGFYVFSDVDEREGIVTTREDDVPGEYLTPDEEIGLFGSSHESNDGNETMTDSDGDAENDSETQTDADGVDEFEAEALLEEPEEETVFEWDDDEDEFVEI